MLTGGGEEDRDRDNRVRRQWRRDATSASTSSKEEDRDNNDDNHDARWWRREDATSTSRLTLSGSGIVHNFIHNREYGMRTPWVSVIFER